jgi:glycosyltransferase involved in cell wall biosynthesis
MAASPHVAIVHDYLSQRGGAERVVLRLASLFPEAPIYTSFYAPDSTFDEFRDRQIVTSKLQRSIDVDHFRNAALRFPEAFRQMDLAAFDKVIVSSSAFAHHVRHPRSLVYCYTPPRFLYEPAAYFEQRSLQAVAWAGLAPLRRSDRHAARRHADYVTISRASAAKIRRCYGVDAPSIIYPPLNVGHLPTSVSPLPTKARALLVSRLLRYKHVDVAIAACAGAGIPLTVVGVGPDAERLARHATAQVSFLGRLADAAMTELFASHSLVLSPGYEDFGYGPVEANYAGRPVVALGAGGALETVEDGVTGRLVSGCSTESWTTAIREVLETDWSPLDLRQRSTRFSADIFDAKITERVAAL